jgi:hypothetical protein
MNPSSCLAGQVGECRRERGLDQTTNGETGGSAAVHKRGGVQLMELFNLRLL